YSNPYNAGRATVAFVARITPATGEIEVGAQMVARAIGTPQPEPAASLTVDALAADEEGNARFGGSSACCLAERATRTVAGQPIGEYPSTGSEGYALRLS